LPDGVVRGEGQVRIARVVMTTLFKLGAALGGGGAGELGRDSAQADILNLLSGVLQVSLSASPPRPALHSIREAPAGVCHLLSLSPLATAAGSAECGHAPG
jgi:hypothetical protein